jgi:hypothetical protein
MNIMHIAGLTAWVAPEGTLADPAILQPVERHAHVMDRVQQL